MEQTITIDVRQACRSNRTGKGLWTFGFVSELLRRRLPVTLLTDAEVPREWSAAQTTVLPARGLLWHVQALRWLTAHPGTTYVSPVSYIVPAFVPKSVRCIPIIHDLIAFLGEPHDRKATLIERHTLPHAVRRVAHLCTISDATRRDLLARFPSLKPERVTPIFAGPLHPHPERSVPDGRTIACVATLCPRKNQLRLIRAYAALPESLRSAHRLVLAGGRGWHDDAIVRVASETPGVEWLGYIDDAAYERLLKTCTVFALPSLYEGFGLQILDAFQRGIPALTSDRGSLKEVAEGAALIVDPEDQASLTDGLCRLLEDAALRTQLQEKGLQRSQLYSWRKTVDLFLSIL